jgi:flavodoxin
MKSYLNTPYQQKYKLGGTNLKTLIIYESVHHGNTEKIAKAMAEILKANMVKAKDVSSNMLKDYDLIGFGSGIFYGEMHKNILNLVDKLNEFQDKKAFVFSTSGMGRLNYNNTVKEKLKEKGFNVVGSFSCRGFDTFGPFKLVGGIAKGRPNDKDIKKAKDFAGNLMKNF